MNEVGMDSVRLPYCPLHFIRGARGAILPRVMCACVDVYIRIYIYIYIFFFCGHEWKSILYGERIRNTEGAILSLSLFTYIYIYMLLSLFFFFLVWPSLCVFKPIYPHSLPHLDALYILISLVPPCMDELHASVRQVLTFYPLTVTNCTSSSPSLPSTAAITMAEAAEGLVTQLVSVLSRGLHDQLDLWTVLETLERVPSRVACEEANNPAQQMTCQLRFSGRIAYLIKSTLARSTAAVRARAVIRLALNQGCLLAALELIARWNTEELRAFYADPSVSVLCSVNGELWDAFLSACAPIGGAMLADIEAGVPKGISVVKFDLKLVLPGLDDVDGTGNDGENGKVENAEGHVADAAVDDPDDRSCVVGVENVYRCGDPNGTSNVLLAPAAKQSPAFGLDQVLVQPIPPSGGNRRPRQKRHGKKVKTVTVHADQKTSSEQDQAFIVDLINRGSEEKEDDDRKSDENFALTPIQAPEAPHENAEDIRSEDLDSAEKIHSVDESGAAEAMLLLDRAERMLLRRWERVSSAISAQEAHTLAQIDEHLNLSYC